LGKCLATKRAGRKNKINKHQSNYQHADKIVDDEFVVPRSTQRPEIKVGVMGFPERASAELGQKLVEDTVSSITER